MRVWRPTYWGFADQALISASNFLVMLLLARQLGPGPYGVFALAYTALLFVNSIQAALFTSPHNALGAVRTGRDYAHYTTTIALAQTLFSLLAATVIALGGLALLYLEYSLGWLILALAPVSVAWQLQEFIRRVMYTQSDYRGAFLNDVIAYGGQTPLIAILWFWDRLTPVLAVAVIGVTSLMGMVVGLWQIRAALLVDWRRQEAQQEMRANWTFGRWLLGSALASWGSGQLYPILTAGFVGVAATGGLRAAQYILAPTQILIKSVDSMLVSKASRAYRDMSFEGLKKETWRIAMPAGVIIVVFCGLVTLCRGPLVVLILGEQYRTDAWLVSVFAATYVLLYASTIASIILRSIEETAPMFVAYLISTGLVLTLGVWMVAEFGMVGTAFGLVLHSVILNAVLWFRVYRVTA